LILEFQRDTIKRKHLSKLAEKKPMKIMRSDTFKKESEKIITPMLMKPKKKYSTVSSLESYILSDVYF